MTQLLVAEVDPFDEAGLGAWVEVDVQASRHEVGDAAVLWSLPELLPMAQEPDLTRRLRHFTGTLDGQVVAAGRLAMRLLDNTDVAELMVAVLPSVRRRGLGSQMLAALEELAAADGRSRFEGMAHWPYVGPPDGAGTAGVAFAEARGYSFGIGEVQRELALPVDEARLARLEADAASYHSGYEIRTWTGPVPDELVVSWLSLASTLMTEAPAGEMEREDEAVDVGAHRTVEAVQAKQGRGLVHAVALDPTGTVVAYSQIIVPPGGRHVMQWGTLVHPAHRGHRLGMAVKVANLRVLQQLPGVVGRRLVTWNAEVNGPMIAINEQLGFQQAARSCELQKRMG